MTKAELRLLLRSRRREFVAALGNARAAQEAAVATRLIARLGACKTIAAYLPLGAELDPQPIITAAFERGLAIALPCIEDSDRLVFRGWRPGDPLVEGPLRLRQPPPDAAPLRPDLIVTPLLGFDRALGRIGQGKGFYDRAFAEHPTARRIGVAWSVQEVDALPLDAWDVPLHGIATENQWIGT